MGHEVNTYYHKSVSDEAINRGAHRNFVGGMWEELGELQLEFLKQQGLLPEHKLLDIGCGCLRGGVKFIDYLERGHYYGLDLNPSLLKAAYIELENAGLTGKHPNLLLDEHFAAERFGEHFDFALAVSVFTHLPLNHIGKCLKQVGSVLTENGAFYATFFQAPEPVYIGEIHHQPGGITTYYDRDPYHIACEEMVWLAYQTGLEAEYIGEWHHPRAQQMFKFSLLR